MKFQPHIISLSNNSLAEQEIKTLRAKVEDLEYQWSNCSAACARVQTERDQARAAPSAPATVQGDADNYRWLRDQHNNVNSDIGVYDGANILATPEGDLDLDAAIAAARQEGGKV